MFETLSAKFNESGAGRWYAGREPGEQKIVAALALLIVLSLLWLILWKPVSDWRADTANRHQNAQQSYDYLKRNEQELKDSVRAGRNPARSSILRLITQAARARGLQLPRVQPESGGGVSVVLQDQPFNDVLAFVAQLEENNGISVIRASIDSSGTPGRVNAQLRFQ